MNSIINLLKKIENELSDLRISLEYPDDKPIHHGGKAERLDFDPFCDCDVCDLLRINRYEFL